MRYAAVSVLSFFVVFPVFADARLPVVNLASAGVSARAAFGEPFVTPVAEKQTSRPVADVAANNAPQSLSVASAPVVSRPTVSQYARTADLGGQIVASGDVLTPRRPSADLWAHSSNSDVVPLRLPTPDEFSVIRSDDVLPEESLNNPMPARAVQIADNTPTVSRAASDFSELDAQIARLNELQRRAEASVSPDFMRVASMDEPVDTVVPTVTNRRVVSRPGRVARTARVAPVQETESYVDVGDAVETRVARADVSNHVQTRDRDEGVKISRMVVPMNDMTDDVVVRAVKRAESPRITSVRDDMTKMSPSELRKAFRKTFLSENKHLSTFQIDDRFDVASDMTANAAGFTTERTLSETGGIRPLEIKIKFRNDDSALSRDNYNLLTEYAGIVLSNPTRAIQVSIPQSVTNDADGRKLAARRLAIIEQVLRDNGISEQRILPVLAARDESDGLLLRMISLEQYETLTKKQRDIFGDTISKKTYRSMSW